MAWTQHVTAFIAAFIIALATTPIIRALAVRWKVGDKPNGRRVHIRMIPHIGGIALVLGALGAMAFVSARTGGADGWPDLAVRIMPALILIVALGLVDDMKSLGAMQKLAIQVLGAAMLVLSGVELFTGVAVLDNMTILSSIVSVLFFVGMSSAVNLIDGHDGLASGVTTISAAAFAMLAWMMGSSLLLSVAVALIGACIGFLVFNFPPGRIYMGDTGSMFLGTMLAILACGLTMMDPSVHTFVGICLILAVPILDAILAVARRLTLRLPVFRADSLHMHHVLQQAGFAPRQTLGILYALQAILAVLGIGAARGLLMPMVVAALVVIVAFLAFIRMMIAVRSAGGRVIPDLAQGAVPMKRDVSPELSRQQSTVGR